MGVSPVPGDTGGGDGATPTGCSPPTSEVAGTGTLVFGGGAGVSEPVFSVLLCPLWEHPVANASATTVAPHPGVPEGLDVRSPCSRPSRVECMHRRSLRAELESNCLKPLALPAF